jgi:hypothetical protein
MVTCDGAGVSRELVEKLDKLASRHGYQLTDSDGWALGARKRAALRKVPETAWEAAVDGQLRPRQVLIEEAHVTELTGLLRQGPDGDQLKTWPETMRVFARRGRPHSGAQLSLLEAADGWRYSLWMTSLPVYSSRVPDCWIHSRRVRPTGQRGC